MSIKEKLTDRVDEVRERRPSVDHVVRMVQHYGTVKGNIQAGAVTYFAFLSFFPILALAFAVVGYLSKLYPGARQNLIEAIDQVLPGLVGTGDGQVPLSSIESAAGAAIGFGLLGLVYSGLGWLASLRQALTLVFEELPGEAPNFVMGKVRDLFALVVLGVVLLLSVAVSAVVTSLSTQLLEWLHLGTGLSWLVTLVAIAIGLGANAVLFFMFFRVLVAPPLAARALWSGALLGAVLFELLKQASRFLLQATAQSTAFQAFGIALILLVWMNYFSRVVMYAAAWAHTDPVGRAERRERLLASAEAEQRVEGPAVGPAVDSAPPAPGRGRSALGAFAAGGLSVLGLLAVLRKRRNA